MKILEAHGWGGGGIQKIDCVSGFGLVEGRGFGPPEDFPTGPGPQGVGFLSFGCSDSKYPTLRYLGFRLDVRIFFGKSTLIGYLDRKVSEAPQYAGAVVKGSVGVPSHFLLPEGQWIPKILGVVI